MQRLLDVPSLGPGQRELHGLCGSRFSQSTDGAVGNAPGTQLAVADSEGSSLHLPLFTLKLLLRSSSS